MLDLRLSEFQIKNADKLIERIKKYPGSGDEVWLNSLYGYPPLEKHRNFSAEMSKAAENFRKNGIAVSLQISNTLGHSDLHASTNDMSGLVYKGSPAEKAVGEGGEKAEYCFCFYGENFRRYISETVKIYASAIKPACVWIDDDLRAVNHAPVRYACFCDSCIARFNNKYYTSFTRKELVNEINYGDVIWRERYIEQNREGVYGLAALITRSVTEVSPSSQMGYQYGRFINYMGIDYRFVLDAMHRESGKKVKTRPGGGFYWDKTPMEMLEKVMDTSLAMSVLPDYVSHSCPEIESLPDVFFGKSTEGNSKESTLYLAYGNNGLTYAALNSGYETEEYDERLLACFSKYRPYWDKLIKSGEKTEFGGVGVYESPNAYKRPLRKGEAPFSWVSIVGGQRLELMKIGVPISHEKKNAKVLVLYPDAVDCMTDDDIELLLQKNVLTDACALEKLIERGFGKNFGASVAPLPVTSAAERFTTHRVNGKYAGMRWKASMYVTGSAVMGYTITDGDGKTESLGEYFDVLNSEKKYGIANALVKTYDGRGEKLSTWSVFGYSLWQDIVSSAKRNQIIGAIDDICGRALPAVLLSPEQVTVVPRIDKDGKTVCVSLQSISIGKTENMELLVRNPRCENFVLTNEDIAERKLDFRKTADGFVVELPPLGAWDIFTVFCEE